MSRDWEDWWMWMGAFCLGMGLGSSIVLIVLSVGGVL